MLGEIVQQPPDRAGGPAASRRRPRRPGRVALERLAAHLHGVPGSQPLRLQDELDVRPARQGSPHVVGPVADDGNHPLHAGGRERVEHILDHRPAGDGEQDLGEVRLHPRAHSGGHHNRDGGLRLNASRHL